jgi:lysozyme
MQDLKSICTTKLIEHEGIKYKPYLDTKNKITIGIGRNLTDRGMSKDEVIILFNNDLDLVISQLSNYDWYNKLDDIRKYVLIDMCFNMGIDKILGFKDMITYLEQSNYSKAADEILSSKFARDTKSRAIDLFKIMRSGKLC